MKDKLLAIFTVIWHILVYSILIAMIPGASIILSKVFAEIGDNLISFSNSNPYIFYAIALVVGVFIYQYRNRKNN